MQNTYFVSAYRQRHGSVEVFPSIINRLSISKDLSFKVLDHMLHNFTEDNRRRMDHHNDQTFAFTHEQTKTNKLNPPINPPGTFLRLDVYIVMIHLQFGDFHLKEVGLKLYCSAHCAKIWP